jgi:hypothetical protein
MKNNNHAPDTGHPTTTKILTKTQQKREIHIRQNELNNTAKYTKNNNHNKTKQKQRKHTKTKQKYTNEKNKSRYI